MDQTPTTSRDLLLPHFDALLAHAPCGILFIARNRRIHSANPKAIELLAEHSENGLVGSDWYENPALSVLLRGVDFDETRRTGRPVSTRACARTGFEGRLNYEATIYALPGVEDEDAGCVVYLTGEAAERDPAREMVQAEKYSALNTVVAGVAHEINNPLTAILGMAQFMLSKAEDEVVARRLRTICESGERCSKIVSNLLVFSQNYKLIKEPQDLNTLLDETVSLCRYQMELDNIDVTVRLDPVLPLVPVQKPELQRVFVAMLNNAHQALTEVSDRPRTFIASTQSHGETVHIIFQDSGPGVPADIQNKIFDPFFSTRSQGAGTGLGLSVAYGLAQDHGGRLWLESAGGRGAKFVIELPIAHRV